MLDHWRQTGFQVNRSNWTRPRYLTAVLLWLFFAPELPGFAFRTSAAEHSWAGECLDLDVTIQHREAKMIIRGTLVLSVRNASQEVSVVVGKASGNFDAGTMAFKEVSADDGVRIQLSDNRDAVTMRLVDEQALPRRVQLEFMLENLQSEDFGFIVDESIAFVNPYYSWYPAVLSADGYVQVEELELPGTTTIRMPKGWKSILTGERLETGEDGYAVFDRWGSERGRTRGFAAGPYSSIEAGPDNRKVTVLTLNADEADVRELATFAANALQILERQLGPYPYPEYVIAEIPEGRAGGFFSMAAAGLTFAKTSALRQEPHVLVTHAHEPAHGWWGNRVNTGGPGSLLIAEGLTQYLAVYALERLKGQETAARFLEFGRLGYSETTSARAYFTEIWPGGEDEPLAKLDGPRSLDLAYGKGAWVFRMLHKRLGDEIFFATLRKILNEYQNKQLTLNALREVFVRQAPPEASIEFFFSQWLDRPGAPVLDVEWVELNDHAGPVIEVKFRQFGEPFNLPLEIEVASENGTSWHAADLSERSSTIRIRPLGKPTSVRVDPQRRILIWRPEYGPRPILPASARDLFGHR